MHTATGIEQATYPEEETVEMRASEVTAAGGGQTTFLERVTSVTSVGRGLVVQCVRVVTLAGLD